MKIIGDVFRYVYDVGVGIEFFWNFSAAVYANYVLEYVVRSSFGRLTSISQPNHK